MTQGKIEVKVGAVAFSGEGEQDWLAEQLEKTLKAASEIAESQPANTQGNQSSGGTAGSQGDFKGTLASYIKEKKAEDSQVERFLATADWLRRRGTQKLTTAAVSKALKDNQQKKLANAADCLNKNVSKGYCEKADGGFYITPEGLKQLGYE